MASSQAILTARRHFFTGGTVPPGLVPSPILRSWSRCAALGLEGAALPRIEPLTRYELAIASERNEAFRRLCRPEIESLHADAEATDSVVILTDAAGLVLDVIGSIGFADRAARVALRPGVPWSEQTTGTNAIGTALTEQSAIEVLGGEHYLECNRILSCSAAPIIGPRGEILGVLDLSGPAAIHQAYALRLVKLAAEQIEHRLFEQGFEHCEVMRVHTDSVMLGTPREGVLAFEEDRLVAANRHGLRMLGLTKEALGTVTRQELFQDSLASLADKGSLRDARGTVLRGKLEQPNSRKSIAPGALRHAGFDPIFEDNARAALARAIRVVNADVPVLVLGETGSGKEVFSRAVHAASNRSMKPFIAVNCAALPETLMEAELFGYEPGAFTGARSRGSKGRLREADGGVLFLDEIGDMPLSLQARLLRVLQDREVLPLGNGKPVPVDFALICATNRDLTALVKEGAFRADLYFRIAQYTVELQPLRASTNRHALIDSLWDQLCGPARVSLSPQARECLAQHDWPGNFRQLAGCLRALIALAEPGETLGLEALPADIRSVASCSTLAEEKSDPDSLEAISRNAMRDAISVANGNVSLAARRLGISRSTLYRRLLSDAGQPTGKM
ncbi:sigma-54-dependent Fis family transcriptional regulator [Microvirga flavescens]|uniref:sigma-54-dependent Fis family transcriptional regulator n=1 Tax=Microvirga flavescens TaxID=2249811 RepID=UPI000DD9ED74|nr:sigma-54-dependent Fis family transcriptional regulator [Microvirga flavescens]